MTRSTVRRKPESFHGRFPHPRPSRACNTKEAITSFCVLVKWKCVTCVWRVERSTRLKFLAKVKKSSGRGERHNVDGSRLLGIDEWLLASKTANGRRYRREQHPSSSSRFFAKVIGKKKLRVNYEAKTLGRKEYKREDEYRGIVRRCTWNGLCFVLREGCSAKRGRENEKATVGTHEKARNAFEERINVRSFRDRKKSKMILRRLLLTMKLFQGFLLYKWM